MTHPPRPTENTWNGRDLGLNVKERESEMSLMTTSQSWMIWKEHDSLSSTKNSENEEDEKLQSLSRIVGGL
jgi:hypothetical protein